MENFRSLPINTIFGVSEKKEAEQLSFVGSLHYGQSKVAIIASNRLGQLGCVTLDEDQYGAHRSKNPLKGRELDLRSYVDIDVVQVGLGSVDIGLHSTLRRRQKTVYARIYCTKPFNQQGPEEEGKEEELLLEEDELLQLMLGRQGKLALFHGGEQPEEIAMVFEYSYEGNTNALVAFFHPEESLSGFHSIHGVAEFFHRLNRLYLEQVELSPDIRSALYEFDRQIDAGEKFYEGENPARLELFKTHLIARNRLMNEREHLEYLQRVYPVVRSILGLDPSFLKRKPTDAEKRAILTQLIDEVIHNMTLSHMDTGTTSSKRTATVAQVQPRREVAQGADELARIQRAKEIFGKDFLGVEAIRRMENLLRKDNVWVQFDTDDIAFPYTWEQLEEVKREKGTDSERFLVLRPRSVRVRYPLGVKGDRGSWGEQEAVNFLLLCKIFPYKINLGLPLCRGGHTYLVDVRNKSSGYESLYSEAMQKYGHEFLLHQLLDHNLRCGYAMPTKKILPVFPDKRLLKPGEYVRQVVDILWDTFFYCYSNFYYYARGIFPAKMVEVSSSEILEVSHEHSNPYNSKITDKKWIPYFVTYARRDPSIGVTVYTPYDGKYGFCPTIYLQ